MILSPIEEASRSSSTLNVRIQDKKHDHVK